jgi:hypothetical protein
MQLDDCDRPAALRRQLALATCALLGSAVAHGESAGSDGGWTADAGALYYGENDGRVQCAEAVVNLRRVRPDDGSLNFKLTVDALSGGSPNGALPSRSVQTFATPSASSLTPAMSGGGEGEHSTVYTVAPGQLPIDKSFHDARFAASAAREQDLGSQDHLSYGAAVSREMDFQSLSANAALAHDFNDKNTTLSLGANLETDSIQPMGGAPVAGSDYAAFRKEGNKTKQVADVLIGVTQVMTRRWLTQLNYSRDHSTGYQSDPYKIVSVLQADGSIARDAGDNDYYLYENRPSARTRQSWYWDNKFAFDRDVLQLSYRYMRDDWGIRSHTVDVHYRWQMAQGAYLEPHLRRYRQSAAEFFTFYVDSTAAFPLYLSADPRLAKFDAATYGIKLGLPFGRDGEWNVRLEQYSQTGSGPAVVPAQLQGLNLYPGLKAWLLQGGLRYAF